MGAVTKIDRLQERMTREEYEQVKYLIELTGRVLKDDK